MESKDTTSKVEEQGLRNLKSDYFIQKFFGYMSERKYLETIRYNKSIQKRINININHYKAYSETKTSIELDIIPMKGEYGEFININEEDKKYFHIYFNDNKKKEIKKTSLDKNDNVSKISIIIDYQIKSFSKLFSYCSNVESIEFKKFYRNNITDMSEMFRECDSLKELNLNNFNTNNVTNMSEMFRGCTSLIELNLNNFNTNKVIDMSWMFGECSSLIELNLNNFNTNKVFDMRYMFYECSDKIKLKIKSKLKAFSEEAF